MVDSNSYMKQINKPRKSVQTYCVANFCLFLFFWGGGGINLNSNQGSLFIVKLEGKERSLNVNLG